MKMKMKIIHVVLCLIVFINAARRKYRLDINTEDVDENEFQTWRADSTLAGSLTECFIGCNLQTKSYALFDEEHICICRDQAVESFTGSSISRTVQIVKLP